MRISAEINLGAAASAKGSTAISKSCVTFRSITTVPSFTLRTKSLPLSICQETPCRSNALQLYHTTGVLARRWSTLHCRHNVHSANKIIETEICIRLMTGDVLAFTCCGSTSLFTSLNTWSAMLTYVVMAYIVMIYGIYIYGPYVQRPADHRHFAEAV